MVVFSASVAVSTRLTTTISPASRVYSRGIGSSPSAASGLDLSNAVTVTDPSNT